MMLSASFFIVFYFYFTYQDSVPAPLAKTMEHAWNQMACTSVLVSLAIQVSTVKQVMKIKASSPVAYFFL